MTIILHYYIYLCLGIHKDINKVLKRRRREERIIQMSVNKSSIKKFSEI